MSLEYHTDLPPEVAAMQNISVIMVLMKRLGLTEVHIKKEELPVIGCVGLHTVPEADGSVTVFVLTADVSDAMLESKRQVKQ